MSNQQINRSTHHLIGAELFILPQLPLLSFHPSFFFPGTVPVIHMQNAILTYKVRVILTLISTYTYIPYQNHVPSSYM